MIDLTKFCSKDCYRPQLGRPFSRGDWTYATNGHICVRVPRVEGVEENPKAPNAPGLFEKSLNVVVWVEPPEVEVEQRECNWCHGKGKIEDLSGLTIGCEDCNETGKLNAILPIQFDADGVPIGLSNIYIDLIRKELPGAKIGLVKEAGTQFDRNHNINVPVKIAFDDGEGLLMPMRLDIARMSNV